MAKKINNGRIDFSSIEKILDYPDFLDLQLQSFKDFLQIETPAEKRQNEGLYKVFAENFPISDSRENFVLEFVDFYAVQTTESLAVGVFVLKFTLHVFLSELVEQHSELL